MLITRSLSGKMHFHHWRLKKDWLEKKITFERFFHIEGWRASRKVWSLPRSWGTDTTKWSVWSIPEKQGRIFLHKDEGSRKGPKFWPKKWLKKVMMWRWTETKICCIIFLCVFAIHFNFVSLSSGEWISIFINIPINSKFESHTRYFCATFFQIERVLCF